MQRRNELKISLIEKINSSVHSSFNIFYALIRLSGPHRFFSRYFSLSPLPAFLSAVALSIWRSTFSPYLFCSLCFIFLHLFILSAVSGVVRSRSVPSSSQQTRRLYPRLTQRNIKATIDFFYRAYFVKIIFALPLFAIYTQSSSRQSPF